MIIIIHRVNTIEFLQKIPKKYGVEIDVRAYKDKLILNHEPFVKGDLLEDYLKQYKHAFIIFNIKEAGIEEDVLTLAQKYKVRNYFLLDVEFPFIYHSVRNGNRKIAIRFSEAEPLQTALKYKNMVDWVWIDTNTLLPLNKLIIRKLSAFKTCLVSPDRWGRPEDIQSYRKRISKLGFEPDAVMTSFSNILDWERK